MRPDPTRRRFHASLAAGAAAFWLPACQRADADPGAELLTPAQQQADLRQWRQAVLDRHPRFAGQKRPDDTMEAAFASALAAATKPQPRQPALAAWTRVNPALRDAHTLLLPWLDGRSPDEAQRRQQFPFGVRLEADGQLRLRSRWQRTSDGSVLPAGAAWLRVPSFDVDDDPAAYRRAVDTTFAQVRHAGVQRLIVDVRGNTGGQSDAGAEIVRRFIERPVQPLARARERLSEDNNGWFGHRGAPGTMREFDLSREGLIKPLPAAERYRGRTVVLIDELTCSAAILFATTMQDHGLARLVGRPTGGHANQTGNMMPTRLRHSGFTVFIATRDFIRPSGDPRPGPVLPDLQVGADADTAAPGMADGTVQPALQLLA